jgi:GntR family transcriptional regulator
MTLRESRAPLCVRRPVLGRPVELHLRLKRDPVLIPDVGRYDLSMTYRSSSTPSGETPDERPWGASLAPLDRTDRQSLHLQVAAEIRRAIAEGEARPGERLPQARYLAQELSVNTNTVLRALRVLRDEGLIEMGRGRTSRVSGTPERGAVICKARELLALSRQSGYRREDLIELLQSLDMSI